QENGAHTSGTDPFFYAVLPQPLQLVVLATGGVAEFVTADIRRHYEDPLVARASMSGTHACRGKNDRLRSGLNLTGRVGNDMAASARQNRVDEANRRRWSMRSVDR